MRDLNELTPDLDNAGEPLEGVVTAGQSTQEHFERLAEAGYRTVIDLRESEEQRGLDEPEVVQQAGMEYVSIPVGHDDIDDENFDQFRELMADQERRPVLVHCSSANRVGAVLIPYLLLDEDKSPEEAREIAARVGLRRRKLEKAAFRYVGV